MIGAAHTAAVQRLVEEGYNGRNLDVLDEIYASDVIFHHALRSWKKRESLKRLVAWDLAQFPDLHVTIQDLLAAGEDKVVMRYVAEGTDTGGWAPSGTPPTGKRAQFTGMTISRFAGDRIVEEWYEKDHRGLQKQLHPTAPSSSAEDLKAKLLRFVEEGLNQHNLDVIDECYAPNAAYHSPVLPLLDRHGIMDLYRRVFSTLPDWYVTVIELLVAEGERIVMRWSYEATDAGGVLAFGLPATGKHVTNHGISIVRFEGGKIVEEWIEADYLGMYKQIQG